MVLISVQCVKQNVLVGPLVLGLPAHATTMEDLVCLLDVLESSIGQLEEVAYCAKGIEYVGTILECFNSGLMTGTPQNVDLKGKANNLKVCLYI